MIEDVLPGVSRFERFTIHGLPAAGRDVDALLTFAELLPVTPERALQLVLPGHDDPMEILLAWLEDGYSMFLLFPMEDFGWATPLVLRGEGLAFEDVREILRGICLEKKGTAGFPIVMNGFRDCTEAVFGPSPAP